MISPELILLDVGHGNCALARTEEFSVLIDVPPKWDIISNTLDGFNITRIDGMFISHQDRDHLSGAIPMLLDERFSVGEILVNPDASKPGAAPERKRVRAAATRAVAEGRAVPPKPLSTETPRHEFGELLVEVLGPPWDVTGWAAAGGTSEEGSVLTGHTLSGVLRISFGGGRSVLLPGDLDNAGLEDLIERGVSLDADFLVFPHHGGHVGDGDDAAFAARFCSAVRPETVVFSHSRTKFRNPLPEIVEAAKAEAPGVYVACTQLSRNCSATTPDVAPMHLVDLPAAGRSDRCCCAGTLRVSLDGNEPMNPATVEAHREFVRSVAGDSALCMQ